MSEIAETKVIGYLVCASEITYYFNSKLEAESFYKLKKNTGQPAILIALHLSTVTNVIREVLRA